MSGEAWRHVDDDQIEPTSGGRQIVRPVNFVNHAQCANAGRGYTLQFSPVWIEIGRLELSVKDEAEQRRPIREALAGLDPDRCLADAMNTRCIAQVVEPQLKQDCPREVARPPSARRSRAHGSSSQEGV